MNNLSGRRGMEQEKNYDFKTESIHTFTLEAVSFVARETGAVEAAHCVRAMGEHITGPATDGDYTSYQIFFYFIFYLIIRSSIIRPSAYLYLHSFSSGISHPLPP